MVKIKSQSPIFIRFFCCVVQGLYQHPDLPKLNETDRLQINVSDDTFHLFRRGVSR